MMLNICIKFRKNISKGYKANTISLLKFSTGHNSIKNVDEVTVFLLCTLFDGAKYLHQVSQKYLKRVHVLLSIHNLSTEIFKGHNSVKSVVEVTVLNLCTLSDGA